MNLNQVHASYIYPKALHIVIYLLNLRACLRNYHKNTTSSGQNGGKNEAKWPPMRLLITWRVEIFKVKLEKTKVKRTGINWYGPYPPVLFSFISEKLYPHQAPVFTALFVCLLSVSWVLFLILRLDIISWGKVLLSLKWLGLLILW